MNRRLLYLLLLSAFSLRGYSQGPPLYFERITVQNGLSHNKVNCILQDKRGFIWIGTNDGLNRYDGHQFMIFRNDPENNSSISGNIITSLVEDSDSVLWIATQDGGLTKYDYRLEPQRQFTQFKHMPGDSLSIPANSINALMEDRQKRLWLATGTASVIVFDKQTQRFIQPIKTGTRGVLSLTLDSYGKIWVGRQGGGIVKITPQTLRYESDPRYDDLYAKLPHAEVSSLYRDRQNHIWFGSWDRQLYRFNVFTQQEETFPVTPGEFVADEIFAFAEDQKGWIWMGGHYNGLQLYDPESQHFYHYTSDPSKEGTISDNRINCIFRDRNGFMWLGTNKGISVSNPLQQQFRQEFFADDQANPARLYTVFEDENDDLLFGTSNGIYIKSRHESRLRYQPIVYKGQKLAVSSFYRDGKNLYIGTNYSLFLLDRRTGKVSLLPNTEKDGVMNHLIESRIVSIIKDSLEGRPVLIVSPYGHFLTYYDLERKYWVSRLDSARNIVTRFGLKDFLIRKLYKTSRNQVWLANVTRGLGEWRKGDPPSLHYYTNDPALKKGLSNNHIYDIVEDATGNLWISTYGGGLHYMDVKTKEIIHIPNSPNLLEGLQTDGHGNIWMICNGDLYKYEPGKRSFTAINLPDVEKSGGVTGYFYRDSKGKMYVGGQNYFIGFHPDSIQVQRASSRILFTDFQVFGRSNSHLLQQPEIVLPYYENTVSIRFAVPNFALSSPLRFAYRMDGIDNDWIPADPSGVANYANLEGGNYRFMVKILNAGNDASEIARLHITIIPPYWKRWWFYALTTLVLSIIILAIYRYRINELVKRQEIRNKIAQDLHDNMGSALSSISIYSRVAQIQNNRSKQEQLQEILEKITTTSTDVISEMNDIVWTINPRNDSMEKILQRMESYARPLAAAQNIAFDFSYDREILSVNLTMEKRKNFYLIFKEAFNNAIKYAEAKRIGTSIQVKRHQIVMEIKDDGKGFDTVNRPTPSQGGNGLANMAMRAKEMKGECRIDAGIGQGTHVYLEFPY